MFPTSLCPKTKSQMKDKYSTLESRNPAFIGRMSAHPYGSPVGMVCSAKSTDYLIQKKIASRIRASFTETERQAKPNSKNSRHSGSVSNSVIVRRSREQ